MSGTQMLDDIEYMALIGRQAEARRLRDAAYMDYQSLCSRDVGRSDTAQNARRRLTEQAYERWKTRAQAAAVLSEELDGLDADRQHG